MLNTSARLLRLFALLQSRRSWTGAELAEKLEIADRTLRRDIDRLRSLDFPIEATPGVAGGYQLAAGATLPPLQLADDEALAVSLALGLAASGNVEGVDEAALRALVKLERVLPSRLKKRARALRTNIQPLTGSGPRVDARLLTQLAEASSERCQITFRYQTKQGKLAERTVDPVGLVPSGHRWYLVGWDHDRNDFRTFRVDRFQSSITLGPRSAARPLPDDGDLRAYVARAITFDQSTQPASILLFAPLEQVRSKLWSGLGTLEEVESGQCRFKATTPCLDFLGAHLLMLGIDFRVEHPSSLVEVLQEMRGRLERSLAWNAVVCD